MIQDKIFNEDCLIGMMNLPPNSIDAIICDLPYGVLNKQNSGSQWDKPLPLDKLWTCYKRVAKQNAAIILFGQGMFTAELMMSNKAMWRYNLIWEKDRPTGFLNANRMPLRSHEDMLVFYSQLPTYNPQYEACAENEKNHSKGKMRKLTNNCYGGFGAVPTKDSDVKHPRSVVRCNKEHVVGSFLHPTQKPVELIRWLIRSYTNEGDTILDNCMGSGTTCVAAIMENRHYVGYEADPIFYDVAKKRIDEQLIDSLL